MNYLYKKYSVFTKAGVANTPVSFLEIRTDKRGALPGLQPINQRNSQLHSRYIFAAGRECTLVSSLADWFQTSFAVVPAGKSSAATSVSAGSASACFLTNFF